MNNIYNSAAASWMYAICFCSDTQIKYFRRKQDTFPPTTKINKLSRFYFPKLRG